MCAAGEEENTCLTSTLCGQQPVTLTTKNKECGLKKFHLTQTYTHTHPPLLFITYRPISLAIYYKSSNADLRIYEAGVSEAQACLQNRA